MSFKLLRDLVLVLPLPNKTQTEGGIVIASIDKTAPSLGVVVTVGPGYVNDLGRFVAPEVKPGDRVVFMRSGQGVQEIKQDKDVLLVVPSAEILAVVVDKSAAEA